MPRDAITLADVRDPTLTIVCERCGRHGRYDVRRLIASAPARIVSTDSDAHQRASLDFNDLQSAKSYNGFRVCDRSKLANILFTRSPGARPERRSRPIASIPASSRRGSAIRAAAGSVVCSRC